MPKIPVISVHGRYISVITVMNTADRVSTTILPFCSCATPWLRKARVSASSVAVLLLRSCKNNADRTKAREYLFQFSRRDLLRSWVDRITQRLATNVLPNAPSPSATSSKLERIERNGRKRLSRNLTLPRVSWLTRNGLLIMVEVVVSAWSNYQHLLALEAGPFLTI
jgi:hypothetical protein